MSTALAGPSSEPSSSTWPPSPSTAAQQRKHKCRSRWHCGESPALAPPAVPSRPLLHSLARPGPPVRSEPTCTPQVTPERGVQRRPAP